MDLEEIVVILLVIAGLVRFPLKPGGIGRRLFGPRDSESWPWAKTNIGCGLVDAISGGEGGMAAPWQSQFHARKKSSASIPACLKIARSVPSGMSPG
jgi:hypothetical protein